MTEDRRQRIESRGQKTEGRRQKKDCEVSVFPSSVRCSLSSVLRLPSSFLRPPFSVVCPHSSILSPLIFYLIFTIATFPFYTAFPLSPAYAADQNYEETGRELEQVIEESRERIREEKRSGPLDSEPPLIRHDPPIEVDGGIEIPIEAIIEDGSKISEATLYFRTKGDSNYRETDMQRTTGDIYQAVIPSSKVSKKGMEYYIEAIDEHENRGSDGRKDIPYLIDVKFMIVDGNGTINKTPWYKKPWIWAIIIGAAGGGAYALSSGGGGDDGGGGGGNTETGTVTGTW